MCQFSVSHFLATRWNISLTHCCQPSGEIPETSRILGWNFSFPDLSVPRGQQYLVDRNCNSKDISVFCIIFACLLGDLSTKSTTYPECLPVMATLLYGVHINAFYQMYFYFFPRFPRIAPLVRKHSARYSVLSLMAAISTWMVWRRMYGGPQNMPAVSTSSPLTPANHHFHVTVINLLSVHVPISIHSHFLICGIQIVISSKTNVSHILSTYPFDHPWIISPLFECITFIWVYITFIWVYITFIWVYITFIWVYITFIWVYITFIWVYITFIWVYLTFIWVYITFIWVYITFIWVYITFIWVYITFIWVYITFIWVYITFIWVYLTFIWVYITFIWVYITFIWVYITFIWVYITVIWMYITFIWVYITFIWVYITFIWVYITFIWVYITFIWVYITFIWVYITFIWVYITFIWVYITFIWVYITFIWVYITFIWVYITFIWVYITFIWMYITFIWVYITFIWVYITFIWVHITFILTSFSKVIVCILSSSVQFKDRCKLYCRVAKSSAYYLLKDTVVDGTKCGPDTSDICVHGHCKVSAWKPGLMTNQNKAYYFAVWPGPMNGLCSNNKAS